MASILEFGEHVVQQTNVVRAFVPGQATAGTLDKFTLMEAERDITVTKVVWVPAAAVTGDDTHNFKIGVVNVGLAGIGTTAVTAVKEYDTGTDSVAHVPEDLTLSATAANLDVDEGEVLILDRTKTGNGLAQPDGVLQVHYIPR